MAKWLMLRGDWDERTADSIRLDDDMWLQLFNGMLNGEDVGRIWLRGNDEREIEYRDCMIESGLSPKGDLSQVDYVFARGGFDYYAPILDKCTNAKIVYYGAGRRHIPSTAFHPDLILVDSPEQKSEVQAVFERVETSLYVKPAAECFEPKDEEKSFDMCFVANGQQASFKGTEWVYSTIPSHLHILHMGYPSGIESPRNVITKRTKRAFMPWDYSRCCVGIVPYFNNIDSCPRVIPEMLACDMPIVVAEGLRFWAEKYITPDTGVVANGTDFWFEAERLFHERQNRPLGIREYYENNLSMPIACRVLGVVIRG